jgi:signal transduction histidine kinase
MFRRQPATAWDAAYEIDRNMALVRRTRWAAGLCLFCLIVACTDVVLAQPEAGALRLKFLGALFALSMGVVVASLVPETRRNPLPLAVAFGVGIVLTLDVYSLLVPNGIEITGASLGTMVMGFAIMVPWGPGAQAIVSATAVGAYGGLWLLGSDDTSSLLSIVVSASIVAVVGAGLLDRYRRASFSQAWQQERLVALAHDLAEREHPAEVVERLLHHAVALVPANACLVAPLLPGDGDAHPVFRVTHVTGTAAETDEQLVGFELPAGSAIVGDILRRGVLLMPADAPDSELGKILASRPGTHALYLALHRGAEVLGIVGWVRRGRPFAPEERRLVARMTDPVALALKTARLLTDLRESSRLKSEFVSTVSHELRTPLNVILGFAEMARDVDFAAEDRTMCLDRIHSAGQELLTLIESTLEVGRLEAARSPVRIEAIPLASFWSELGQTCLTIPHAPGVRLEWSSDAPDATITTDPHKLRVMVRNLVGNALKFTVRGHVRASIRLDGQRLELCVADTGIGIRPEDQRVIFEMFRQADGSDARRFGGTGLGLYIVRRFAEQLGATIDLVSAPGTGSTFRITLPVLPANDESARRAA